MLETYWCHGSGSNGVAQPSHHAVRRRALRRAYQISTAIFMLDDRGMKKATFELPLDGDRLVRLYQSATFTFTTGLDECAAAGIGDNELVAEYATCPLMAAGVHSDIDAIGEGCRTKLACRGMPPATRRAPAPTMAPIMRRPADSAAIRLRLPKLKLRRLVAASAGSGGRDGSLEGS
jgi:hypothetical protein